MEHEEDEDCFGDSKRSDYQKIEKIGSGAYGSVYKAKNIKTQKIVAIKRIKISLDTEGIPSSALREITILRNLNHENIEKILDVIATDTKLYLVFEYLDYDLQTFYSKLLSQENNNLIPYSPPQLTKIFLKQILKGVDYIHSKKIIHRDLKPQNILVNNNLVIKLADFGLSRAISFEKRPYTQEVLSLWYRAPELLLGANEYNESIDIWSIGCVFAFMALKNTLFEGENEIDQINKILQFFGTPNFSSIPYYNNVNLSVNLNNLPICQPANFNEKFFMLDNYGKDLLQRMLLYDPDKRISCKDALNHPYFNNNYLNDNLKLQNQK